MRVDRHVYTYADTPPLSSLQHGAMSRSAIPVPPNKVDTAERDRERDEEA